MSPTASALEISRNKATLLEMNIPEEIIEVLPADEVDRLVSAYLQNPDSVEVSTSTLEVNVLEEMSVFVRNSDEELLEMGYSEAQISRANEIIAMYNNSSDDELLASGLSEIELNYLRAALDPDSEILPQGQIPSSKLTLTQTVTDYCSSNYTNYFINVSFKWDTPYAWDSYEDKVIIAWGGDLAHESVSQSISYWSKNTLNTQFANFKEVANASYAETDVNRMGMYIFPQGYYQISTATDSRASIARSGNIRYELYQNGFQNRHSKVLAYYAHQILTLTGSILFTGDTVNPSVTINQGYDYLHTESKIKY